MIRKTSQKGIELIIQFEELRLDVYSCPAGVLTVGVGHAVLPDEPYKFGQVHQSRRSRKTAQKRFIAL